jgi:uncharacterized protein (TIGR02646 family)
MKKLNKHRNIPEKLNQYFHDNPNNTWEAFGKGNKNRYKDVINQIKEDQGAICCYCENNFHNQTDKEGDFRVEHFHPKSDKSNTDVNWNLIWTNLLGCCSGGNQNIENPEFLKERFISNHEERHCDVKKDNNNWDDEILNPLDIPAFPPLFKVYSTGEMKVLEENCQNTSIDIVKAKNCLDEKKLNLNSPNLVKWRKGVKIKLKEKILITDDIEIYESLIEELLDTYLIKDNNDNFQPFFSTIRSHFGKYAEEYLRKINYDG